MNNKNVPPLPQRSSVKEKMIEFGVIAFCVLVSAVLLFSVFDYFNTKRKTQNAIKDSCPGASNINVDYEMNYATGSMELERATWEMPDGKTLEWTYDYGSGNEYPDVFNTGCLVYQGL
jgi:hypothetical protein